MRRPLLAATVLAALLAASCFEFLTQSKTSPSSTGVDGLNGSWASVSSATTLQDTCTDFAWTVTDISGNTASGTFSATCLDTLQVTGTASGTLSGSTVTWTASGTATGPGGTACPVSLSGTATFDGTQIRIPYSGTTCLGPVSGTEVLRRPS
jgi:hypothetical protein